MKQLAQLVKFSKELWKYYFAVGFFTILLALLNQLLPLLTKGALDEITKIINGEATNNGLVILFVVLIFLQDVASTVFSNVGGYIGDQLSVKLQKLLSERYFAHLLTLHQGYFDTELSGKITARLNRSITQLTSFVNMMANNFLQFIFSTIFTLIIVFYYSWQVGLLLASLYPIFLWLTTRTSVRWQEYQQKKNSHQDIAFGRFQESVTQVKVVKSFAQEDRELSFFNKHFSKIVALNRPQSSYWHKRDVERRLVLNLIFFGVYGFILWQASRQTITLTEAVLLIQYAALIRIPIFSMSYIVDNTQKAIADSKDYFEVMNQRPQISDSEEGANVSINDGRVQYQNVDFAYEEGEKVLKNITFTVEPGQKVAFVGESGEGKTTLTNLLLRLYEPTSGRITIDEQDITKVSQKSLRSHIAVVFQDPALFSGTIKENIAYANPRANEEAIIAAAKAANAHEFIQKFEKGYDSEIGERGLKLSGGQKQRIAIARALLKDAPILVLDEATSSLDSKSEASVQEALERLMQGRTTFIVAHRLSTIKNVDIIITIKGGRVDEIGSPAKLARTDGIYAQLLSLQDRKDDSKKQSLKKFDIES